MVPSQYIISWFLHTQIISFLNKIEMYACVRFRKKTRPIFYFRGKVILKNSMYYKNKCKCSGII